MFKFMNLKKDNAHQLTQRQMTKHTEAQAHT